MCAASLVRTCSHHNDVLNTFASCSAIATHTGLNGAAQIEATAIDSNMIGSWYCFKAAEEYLFMK